VDGWKCLDEISLYESNVGVVILLVLNRELLEWCFPSYSFPSASVVKSLICSGSETNIYSYLSFIASLPTFLLSLQHYQPYYQAYLVGAMSSREIAFRAEVRY
jgi:hypothetical protein